MQDHQQTICFDIAKQIPLTLPSAALVDLFPQTEFFDGCKIGIAITFHEISQEPVSATDHGKQATPRMEILAMFTEMLRNLFDTPGEQRNLHLGRTNIALMPTKCFDCLATGFLGCRHRRSSDKSVHLLAGNRQADTGPQPKTGSFTDVS